MLGDAKTVSDEDNERGSRSFAEPGGWTTPSSLAGLGQAIAPSWDDDWTAPDAPTAEPNPWETTELLRDSDQAPEPRGFADWGGLAATNSTPVSHDLSAWDSPSDAVVAEIANAPWSFGPAVETPAWAVEADTEPMSSTWPTLPDPPSNSAAAWAPAPPLPDAPSNAPSNSAEAWAPALPLPLIAESNELAEPAESAWTNPAMADGPADSRSPVAPAPLAWSSSQTDEPPENEASTIAIDTEPTTVLDEREQSATTPLDGDTGTPEVPFSELASEPTEDDQALLGPVPVVPPAIGESAMDDAPASGSAGAKRRGRLAARSAKRSVAPGPDPAAPVDAAADDEILDPAAIAEPSAHLTLYPEPDPHEATLASDDSAFDAAQMASIEPLIVAEATRPPLPTTTGRSFFARHEPKDATMSSGETPKVLRIAAVTSLLIGLGLFGFSVVNSRSSDTKPTIAPPPATAAPTLPTAPAAEISVSANPATDPIIRSGETAESVTDFAGAVTNIDPIFGSEDTARSATVSTGATVVVDPAPSSSKPTAADPIFGSPAAVATKVAGVGVSGDDELSFD